MDGYAVSLYYGPPVPYVFCHSSFIFHHRVHHHIVHDRHLVHRIAQNTRVHPTPYRVPARPTRHTSTAAGARPAAPPPSGVPRGPRMSAAGIPRDVVPARRAAPPPDAVRLSPRRTMTTSDVQPRRVIERDVRLSPRDSAPETRRPAGDPVRRNVRPPTDAAPPPRTRTSVPERVHVEPRRAEPAPRRAEPAPRRAEPAPRRAESAPRRVEPARIRPPSTSRDLGPVRRVRRP
jgi:hypothetical protein